MRSLRVSSRSVGVVLLIGLWFSARTAVGLEGNDPEDWPALSLPAFVVEVRGTLRDESVSPATRTAAATQAAERLTGLSAGTQVAYADLLWLNYWAGDALTAAQKTALAPRRALPRQEIPNWSINALRSVFAAQFSTKVPLGERDAALTTWLANKTDATAYQANARDAAFLVTKVRNLRHRRQGASGISDASLTALRVYAGQLLAQAEVISQAPYKDVIALFEWSQNQMSPEGRAAAQARIAAPLAAANEIKDWKLHELQSADIAMKDTQVAQDIRDTVVSQWLQVHAHDVANVPALGQLAWLAMRARRVGVYSPQFSVTWTGHVKAPADGRLAEIRWDLRALGALYRRRRDLG